MRLAHASLLPAPPQAVVEVLHRWEAWSTWVPGVELIAPASEGPPVVLDLVWTSVRPIRARVEVRLEPGGLVVDLIEGNVASLEGSVTVVPTSEGSEVSWSLAVDLVDPLPGPLASELEAFLLPRWHRALAARLP